MYYPSIKYNEPIFRPPGEAYSVIFQVTIGCSWNKCTFCEMYTSKRFSVRKFEDIEAEIKTMAEYHPDARKIFLGDGNAMVLSTNKLVKILDAINLHFPKLRQVSTYALPNEVLKKTDEELALLKSKKLSLIYVGLESGDNEILRQINKGETQQSAIDGLLKAKKAGIKSSVMILNGMGGKAFSEQHAKNSAELLNATNPEFLSTLVLSYPYGLQHFKDRYEFDFEPLNTIELIEEIKLFIESMNLQSTVFRSNHASNYLALEGTLPKDKQKLLNEINQVLQKPETANLREEWQRGL